MSHHLYQSEGFILGHRRLGEANKLYDILTSEWGVIRVSAQGVRRLHSKLRYHLDDFCHISLTLVRGRELWRLTGAEQTGRFTALYADRAKLVVVARIFSFLRRFLADEGEEREVYQLLLSALATLEQLSSSGPTHSSYADWETLTILRLLYLLGYIKEDRQIAPHLSPTDWSPQTLESFQPSLARARALINLSLHHSHL